MVVALEGSGDNSSIEKMPLETDGEKNKTKNNKKGRLLRGGGGENVKETEDIARSQCAAKCIKYNKMNDNKNNINKLVGIRW